MGVDSGESLLKKFLQVMLFSYMAWFMRSSIVKNIKVNFNFEKENLKNITATVGISND